MSAHDQEECLNELISRFHERLDFYDCRTRTALFIGHLLENEIIPMFAPERWATGPDQLTRHPYGRISRALQLASLFLTEDSVLGWFAHFTFGDRKKNSSGHMYIASNEYARSDEAIERVKKYLHKLSKVITLMLRPAGCKNEALDHCYGATYDRKRKLPFYNRFRERDWPYTPNDNRYHPVIVMHHEFAKYFHQDLTDAETGVWLRTQFLFATTLVHEVAHAYCMWLDIDGDDEPRWDKHDRQAELGFSWEKETLGYICNPIFHEINGCEMLFSMKAVPYNHDSQQPGIVRELVGWHPFHFNRMNPAQYADLFHMDSYRGGSFYAGEGFNSQRKWVIAIYALSLEWIFSWFDKHQWECRHQQWQQGYDYVPPSLGAAFVLVYQKNGGHQWVHYPLDPRIGEDAQNILREAEMERRRGGDKLPVPGHGF